MTPVRTLPIRLPPISGEALDSWLEAIAHRNATAFGDLLTAVGLKPYHGTATTGWIVTLSTAEAATIAAATGLIGQALDTMTLAHYAGRAVKITKETRTLSLAFPWGGARGSRYCPTCLQETGGRWQLSWRLGWTFACLEHHCLLADACPHCGAVQRRRTHVGELIPQASGCAHPATSATGRSPARCGADLTTATVEIFDAEHPAITAQRTINALLDTATVTTGAYRNLPQPRFNVLCDIRAVAGRALAYGTPQDLQALIPADLLGALYRTERHEPWGKGIAVAQTKPGLAAPARAATAAVGVVAALDTLQRGEVAAAGTALRWLVTTSRGKGLNVTATNIGWGKNTTPVLTGIQLTALSPDMTPSDQLRYRIGSALPTRPPTGGATTASPVSRAVPTMLWPEASLRLAIPTCHQRQLRPALSSLLCLINTRANLDEAARWVDNPINGHAVSRVVRLLASNERWPGIRTALIRLADHLTTTAPPIDYQRRRRLDYIDLLPDNVWKQICRDTATPGSRAARVGIARCFLLERISGSPASASPHWVDSALFQTKVADFPQYLTTELAQLLDEHARDFLAGHGIDEEPLVWTPPSNLFDGIDLPGEDPNAIDIGLLHDNFVARERFGLGAAADRLGISLEAARYLLTAYPAPPVESASRSGGSYRAAKAALPRERLVELYQHQGKSLRDLAATVGVDRNAIAALARDYGITLREPKQTPRTVIERDWLYEQYVNRRRALPDIAAEVGMSTANVARWARKYQLPMRPRGGASHSSTLRAEIAAAQAPEFIRPALSGVGGWERLERFAAAARYTTLTVAAEQLGVNLFTLVNQINRVEAELGMKLLRRAERCHPMRLTDEGERVVASVRALESTGW
jgi:transposase